MDFTFISNTCNGTIVYYLPEKRTRRKQLVGFEPLRFRGRRCAQTISLPVLRCKMLSKVCYVNLSQSREIEIWFGFSIKIKSEFPVDAVTATTASGSSAG